MLSPTLSEIVSPKYSEIECLGNNFFKVIYAEGGYGRCGLIDITGKEIIQGSSSDTIEFFGEYLFKVTCPFYAYGEITHEKNIKIIDQRGKIIADVDVGGGDILYLNGGLMIIREWGSDNLVNMQGKRIFNSGFQDIVIRDNGFVSLKTKFGWGVGTIDGEIIIDPIYANEIIFENDTAPVKVSNAAFEQKINREGLVLVNNGETEITLPKGVYWMSDFVNGICIVEHGRIDNYWPIYGIGAIDQKGNEIIPPIYEKVSLLSDNTFQVVDYQGQGIFDIEGNVIFPPIFTVIKRIAKDRIQVQWNPQIAKVWDNTGYAPKPSDEEKTNIIGEFRSTLCNSKGEVVCDKEYLVVGKFINQFARAYKEIYMDNDKIRYRQAGVIDITGKTVVEPIYDGIVLYENIQYAKLKKDGKYGIVLLQSEKDYPIVINCEYDDIRILHNGLVKVANNNGDTPLFGLYDLNGKKLLPVKYRTISFNNDVVTAEDTAGKKCEYTFELNGIPIYVYAENYYSYDGDYPEAPSIIISGTIPKSRDDNYYDHYDSYYDYSDDDSQYSKYGGYNGWDDFTIDEAFDGNPESTWNVD